MAPIRVGFLGLSKSGWAPGAHLPYLQESLDYEIVAICNSSVESSKEAIKLYSLPATTKAYGDPEGSFTRSRFDIGGGAEHVSDE
jgi:predicted dehydrogenase